MLELDHLAVAGSTLAEAVDAVEAQLGVAMQPGGQHDVFGTHNRLLGLEDGLYLEAISIDPQAPAPPHPRWFDLDRFSGQPRLTNWICRTADLPKTLAELPQAGDIVDLNRGDLRWQMAVPSTGILPFDNLHPALIRWRGHAHPAQVLSASGCRLRRLVISHPDAGGLHDLLLPHLSDTRIAFETGSAGMAAEFDTPHGPRVLQ